MKKKFKFLILFPFFGLISCGLFRTKINKDLEIYVIEKNVEFNAVNLNYFDKKLLKKKPFMLITKIDSTKLNSRVNISAVPIYRFVSIRTKDIDYKLFKDSVSSDIFKVSLR